MIGDRVVWVTDPGEGLGVAGEVIWQGESTVRVQLDPANGGGIVVAPTAELQVEIPIPVPRTDPNTPTRAHARSS